MQICSSSTQSRCILFRYELCVYHSIEQYHFELFFSIYTKCAHSSGASKQPLIVLSLLEHRTFAL